VADELKTCANCGNTQATGAFCEACGAKLPAAAAAGAAATSSPEPVPVAAPAPPPPAQPQYAPQPQYGTPPPPGGSTNASGKGFWARFFDLSFSEYITPSVIKVLFIVIMVVIGLSILGGIIIGFIGGVGTGVFALIGGLIYGFLTLLFARVWLEVIMVFFRIHDNTEEIVRNKR
jgi:hypothetical protein